MASNLPVFGFLCAVFKRNDKQKYNNNKLERDCSLYFIGDLPRTLKSRNFEVCTSGIGSALGLRNTLPFGVNSKNLRETSPSYLKFIDRKSNSSKVCLSFIFFRLGGQTTIAGSEITVGLAR